MPKHAPTLLFDFDGTVSLGDGPVLAYARFSAAELAPAAATRLLQTVRARLALAKDEWSGAGNPIDGYDLVRSVALTHGVSERELAQAYTASRENLATAIAPVEAVDGLAALLRELRQQTNLVLATNAPDTRLYEALAALQLSDSFDAVYTSVGKPTGLDRVLDEWLPRGPLLAIGDVWSNDLQPAHARGADTALVGPTAHVPGTTPTLRSYELTELFPAIRDWVAAHEPLPSVSAAPSL